MAEPVYYYQWQNPILVEDIYPFRKAKLIDFLATFEEARIWKEYQEKGEDDPEIKEIVVNIKEEMQQRRATVDRDLKKMIEDRLVSDKYFALVSGRDEENLRRKRIYYLERILRIAENNLGEMEYTRNRNLKKAEWDWSGAADPEAMKQRFLDRAAELITKIQEVEKNAQEIQKFLNLYEQQAQLPEVEGELSLSIAALFKIRKFREELKNKNQHELLQLILDSHFDKNNPDKFWLNQILPYPDPENQLDWKDFILNPDGRDGDWLEYMTIHFSGMRYKSAHGSWADPCYLLQLLESSEIEDELDGIHKIAPDQIRQMCDQTVKKLEDDLAIEIKRENERIARVKQEKEQAVQQKQDSRIAAIEVKDKEDQAKHEKSVKFLKFYIARLKWQFCLTYLKRYRSALKVAEIEQANEAEKDAALDMLVAFKERKAKDGDPIPEWAWAEMVKYTRLRNQLAQEGWERYDPARWKWESRRWYRILVAWESKDITSWREHHHTTLDLIVTRAVCNEISEHIQHVRGLKPAGGLTGKTQWFYKETRRQNPDEDLHGPFFRQAFHLSDFIPGASIFWSDWQEREPTQWQMVIPFGPFEFLPVGSKIQSDGFTRLEPDKWTYQRWRGGFKRTRRQLKRKELKRLGKSKEEIEKILAEKSGPIVEYLRWTHEAIIVGTVDLISGRYVLTFETGKTGLNLRWFSYLAYNPSVFIGYLPDQSLPVELEENLQLALDRKKVLKFARS
jgi:hypothetical protein